MNNRVDFIQKLLVLASLFFNILVLANDFGDQLIPAKRVCRAILQQGLPDIDMNSSSNGASNRPMAGGPDIVVSMAGTSADASCGVLTKEDAILLANSETEMAANLLPEVKVDLDVCSDGRVLIGLFQSLKIKCSDKEIEVQANTLMLSHLLAAKRRVVSSPHGSMFKDHDKLDLSQYPSNFIIKFNDFLENKIKPSELSVKKIIRFLNLADYLQLKEESKIKELCKELINKNFYFEDMKNTGLSDAALKYYLQTYIKERTFDLLNSGIIKYKEIRSIDCDGGLEVAISADGKIAIMGPFDKKVRVIEVETGRVLHEIAYDGSICAVAISYTDSKMAIAGEPSKTVGRIEVIKGREIHKIAYAVPTHAVAISADGNIAIIGSMAGDNTTRIIDVATGRVMHKIVHDGTVDAAAISADGKMAITGSYDTKARIIEVETGRVIHEIAHGAAVYVVGISASGEFAITGSWDKKVRIIEVATGRVIHELAHDCPAPAVAISADAKIAITGSRDKKLRIVKLDLPPENADLGTLIGWYNKVNGQQEAPSAPGTSSQASQLEL